MAQSVDTTPAAGKGSGRGIDHGFDSREYAAFEAYIASNASAPGLDESVEPPEVVTAAARVVAKWLRDAQGKAVVLTGAGVSTGPGAALPTYRGPDGVWTRRIRNSLKLEEGSESDAATDAADDDDGSGIAGVLASAEHKPQPTLTHRGLTALVDAGLIGCVATTNVDGLHAAAGLVRGSNYAELHGSLYVEACSACGAELCHNPLVDAPLQTVEPETRATGTSCKACGGAMEATLVGFFDTHQSVPSMEQQFELAWVAAATADLMIVLGSSLSVETTLPGYTLENGGRLVIVNLQPTHLDDQATLVVHARSDDFVADLQVALELPVCATR
ncbi:NAD-dependent deacetylase sirtuin-6 [Thecamonas trahens ATCC 50062]|uniref:Regulatory protein SIR2 homolog 7 n=1 Tax=Thecamonas trahens ATCC 50062 TaxID=461836 RepID=A0A0L0D7S5_THETB|nr:NAD-dependent deacetylase sirtuin-6 [Thecamonas trahens ATCC 50062]KNC48255.1 NAD-dependent deacetylase sirtuin-6 [Thecamonas trahens ATCC 50062]|eukprot:XP_013758824.1 NAD-dependent deacetylase sirtuin-6 [Thecamonas trahens ATCC 50062]